MSSASPAVDAWAIEGLGDVVLEDGDSDVLRAGETYADGKDSVLHAGETCVGDLVASYARVDAAGCLGLKKPLRVP